MQKHAKDHMDKSIDKNNIGQEVQKPDFLSNAVIACLIGITLIVGIQIAATYLNLASYIERETDYPSIETGIQASIEQLTFAIDNEVKKDRSAALADVYYDRIADRVKTIEESGTQILKIDEETYKAIVKESTGVRDSIKEKVDSEVYNTFIECIDKYQK